MGVRAAVRRMLRRRPTDDNPLDAKERRKSSAGFFEERAKALGPDAYDHVDVDREFRRP